MAEQLQNYYILTGDRGFITKSKRMWNMLAKLIQRGDGHSTYLAPKKDH